tara:strand:- start:1336 stop:1485 length:150 start_codon:yes stop_codon:yes gene_type:complete
MSLWKVTSSLWPNPIEGTASEIMEAIRRDLTIDFIEYFPFSEETAWFGG